MEELAVQCAFTQCKWQQGEVSFQNIVVCTPHLLLQEQAGQLLLQVMLSHSLQKMWQHTGDRAAALLWQMHSGAA